MAAAQPLQLLLASSNPHKLDEIQAVLGLPLVQWCTLADLDIKIDEPIEDQPTFEGNALLKARHYAHAAGMACVADDSGLVVDALDGEPGVHSARYSGVSGPRDVVDPANNRKLLEALGAVDSDHRTARFVCVMALALPPSTGDAEVRTPLALHEPVIVRGHVEGRIILPKAATDPAHPERGRGQNGFGYDPLFELPPDHPQHPGRTTAELTAEQKNAISHRGVATRLLAEQLQQLLRPTAD